MVMAYLADERRMLGFDLGDLIVALIDAGYLREEELVLVRWHGSMGWVSYADRRPVLDGEVVEPVQTKYGYVVVANNEGVEFEQPETIEDVRLTLEFILTEVLLADVEDLIRAQARGSYQQDLIAGRQIWSGADLTGAAANWGSRYANSRHELLTRINAALPDNMQAVLVNVLYGQPRRWHTELVFSVGDYEVALDDTTMLLWSGHFERILEPEEWK